MKCIFLCKRLRQSRLLAPIGSKGEFSQPLLENIALKSKGMTNVTHLSYVPLDLLRLGVAHGVLEPRQSYPEPVEAVVRPVDCEDGGPGVGLGHAPVPLEDDDLGPDLVVDRVPLAHHLRDVVLQQKDRERIL